MSNIKLITMGLPTDEQIVSRNKFIADQIYPLVIKPIDDKRYIMLFSAYENCTESFTFLQLLILAENLEAKKFIDNMDIHINKICHNIKLLNIYNDIIKKLKSDNLYSTDLRMKESEKFNAYYKCTAIKKNNDNAEVLDVYIARNKFIAINLYLNKLDNFIDNKFLLLEENNMKKFESIEKIEYDSSMNFGTWIISHYVLYSSPYKKYKVNIISKPKKDKILISPLSTDLYLSFYKEDILIKNKVEDSKYIYLIYDEYDREKVTGYSVLKIAKELANKNGIINTDIIYY